MSKALHSPCDVERVLKRAIETLAASRHLIGKYTPDHHWLPEHDERIAELKAAITALHSEPGEDTLQTQGSGVPPQAGSGCQPSASAAEEASSRGGIPNAWPSNAAVLAVLRERDPDRYSKCRNFDYTPGSGEPRTAEEVAEQILRVDEEMRDPIYHLIGQLGGEAFLLRDASQERIDVQTMEPVAEDVEAQRDRQRKARWAELMRRAADELRKFRDAQGIEARRAIDSEAGVVGDESPIANGDAPK